MTSTCVIQQQMLERALTHQTHANQCQTRLQFLMEAHNGRRAHRLVYQLLDRTGIQPLRELCQHLLQIFLKAGIAGHEHLQPILAHSGKALRRVDSTLFGREGHIGCGVDWDQVRQQPMPYYKALHDHPQLLASVWLSLPLARAPRLCTLRATRTDTT